MFLELQVPSSRSRNNNSVMHKQKMPSRKVFRPHCDWLQPCPSNSGSREKLILESEDEEDAYEEKNGQDGLEQFNEMDDNDADDSESENDGVESDQDDEGDGEEEQDGSA